MRDYSHYDFDVFNPDVKHNLYIDADTIIYANAAVCEKDECTVTHKASGRKKTFANFPTFVDFLTNDEKGKNFKLEDFEVPVIGFAIGNVKKKLNALIELAWVEDYQIYVGGVGNYRKDMYDEYKANRGAKPLLHRFCYDYVLRTYAPKVTVCNGYEAEDHCLADARADKRGVIGYVDKDLEGQDGLFYNYNKPDLGVYYINKLNAFYNLCVQLMIGDSTDNIKGIKHITPQLKEKYKITTKSIGKATAAKLLAGTEHDIQLMKERIVDVYKLSYHGEWKGFLDFTGKLVYITPKRYQIFDVDKFLEGVNYDD